MCSSFLFDDKHYANVSNVGQLQTRAVTRPVSLTILASQSTLARICNKFESWLFTFKKKKKSKSPKPCHFGQSYYLFQPLKYKNNLISKLLHFNHLKAPICYVWFFRIKHTGACKGIIGKLLDGPIRHLKFPCFVIKLFPQSLNLVLW